MGWDGIESPFLVVLEDCTRSLPELEESLPSADRRVSIRVATRLFFEMQSSSDAAERVSQGRQGSHVEKKRRRRGIDRRNMYMLTYNFVLY